MLKQTEVNISAAQRDYLLSMLYSSEVFGVSGRFREQRISFHKKLCLRLDIIAAKAD